MAAGAERQQASGRAGSLLCFEEFKKRGGGGFLAVRGIPGEGPQLTRLSSRQGAKLMQEVFSYGVDSVNGLCISQ